MHPENRVMYGVEPIEPRKRRQRGILWATSLLSAGRGVEKEEEEWGLVGDVWSIDLHEHSVGSGAAFLFLWLGELRQLWKVRWRGMHSIKWDTNTLATCRRWHDMQVACHASAVLSH